MGRSQNLTDSEYSIQEQGDIYEECLKDVYNNPRWYLDNLDSLRSFRVAWKNYGNKSSVTPYRLTKNFKQ